MKAGVLDANVLLRFFLQDEPGTPSAQVGSSFMESAQSLNNPAGQGRMRQPTYAISSAPMWTIHRDSLHRLRDGHAL